MISVLIIHKRKASIRKLERMLHMLRPGLQITTASSGKAGIAAVVDNPPDSVVIAEKLPDMSGLEACSQLSELKNSHKLTLVFLSDWEPDFEKREQAFAHGANLLLSEPLVEEECKAFFRLLFRLHEAENKENLASASSVSEAFQRQNLCKEVLDKLFLPLLLLDAELRIIYANAACENLNFTGVKPISCGTYLRDTIPSEILESRDLENLAGSVAHGSRENLELDISYIDAEQETVHLCARLHALKLSLENMEERHVLLTLEPVTERKIVEMQLRQADKMDSIARLASGVAHDFNNALMVVQTSAEFLKERFSGSQDAELDIDLIIKVTEHARSLTEQLLTLCRKKKTQMEVLNLNLFISNIKSVLSNILGEKIRFEMELGNNVHSVMADVVQIQQVLMNLMLNARDSIKGDGTVTLKTGNVRLSDSFCQQLLDPVDFSAGEYVRVQLIDTGEGIDEKLLSRIFDPFFTTKEAEGTGLGLSQVYSILKNHGGFITVDSNKNEGSIFTIYLPKAKEESKTKQLGTTGHASSGAPEAGVVLVVEDEEKVRTLLVRALAQWNFQVLQASDGVEAIELVTAEKPKIDILLTDLVMPRMSGHTLASTLLKTLPDMKVVYISGYDNAYIPAIGDQQAFFLQKPYSKEDLTDIFDKLLR